MTVLWGDTGKIAYGTLKTFNIQCATPREVSLGSITLPNTEGITNQASFTVQQTDLPIITPSPVSMKYVACIITSGRCVTGANVNYRIFKNGSSVTTTFGATTANNYWSQNHWRWFDVQAGDVLEVRHWSNQTDTTLDYACLMIYPGNVVLSKINTILKDLTFTIGTSSSTPTPTGAGVRTVLISNTGNGNFAVASNTTIATGNGLFGISVTTGTPPTFPAIVSSSLGIFRVTNGGDASGTATTVNNHATNISIQKNGVPASISFREVLR